MDAHNGNGTRRSSSGRWEAPIHRVYQGIVEVSEITLEDGSRWEGIWVHVLDGETPEQSVEAAVQSLIDQGELERCLTRLDDPGQ
jgi:hypothetical protein